MRDTQRHIWAREVIVFSAAMLPEIAALGLAIGLLLSLLCYLTTNLSPGGMITPGWLGLTLLEDYRRAGLILIITGATFLATKLLNRVVILYGKRLFAAVVLTSVLLQTALFIVIQQDFPLLFASHTLGFVVPGLIAYQLMRQPPVPTVLATGAISLATYAVLISGVLAGLLPTI